MHWGHGLFRAVSIAISDEAPFAGDRDIINYCSSGRFLSRA